MSRIMIGSLSDHKNLYHGNSKLHYLDVERLKDHYPFSSTAHYILIHLILKNDIKHNKLCKEVFM